MPRLKPRYQLDLESLPPKSRSVVDQYLLHRRRTKSTATLTRDRSIITRWACWCLTHGVDLVKARLADAETFAEEWPWATNTKRQAITDLGTFYEWLLRRELAIRNPWKDVERPRKPRRIPVVLTEAELARLPGAMDRPTIRDLRDRAILCVLVASGARIGEVRSMELGRLNLEAGYAIVHSGKTDKDRIIRLDQEAVRALTRWLQVRHIWARSPSGPVFVGRHGDGIGYTACHDLLRRAKERAGILRQVNLHLFRHTFATQALAAGANLREVQELLGHERISTTEIYTHVDPTRLEAVYDRIRRRPGDPPPAAAAASSRPRPRSPMPPAAAAN